MLRTVVLCFKLIFISFIFFFNWACGPFGPLEKILPVPFRAQQGTNWCANACVQMWALYDGYSPTQAEIAAYMGNSNDTPVSRLQIETAVWNFTDSFGYLAKKSCFSPGSQGDLISATITGIKENVPSIMPYQQFHVVIIKGYKWDEGDDGKPIAIDVIYHDPNIRGDIRDTANQLEQWFDHSHNDWNYWVILADEWLLSEGIYGHDEFVRRRGVYYGGPPVYNPKGIPTYPPPPPPPPANKS